MPVSETPKALGPCPTDEDLAAFLDGMLPADERSRITTHLADCESCFEIFAGAVHFQQDAAGRKGGGRTILPFPAEKIRPRVRPWQWAGFAAAAVVALGVGFGVYRMYLAEPRAVVADLVEPLSGRPGLVKSVEISVSRGSPEQEHGDLVGPPFMVGARLVDLQVSLALGQTVNAANALKEMSGDLKQVVLEDDDASQCLQDATALEPDGSPATRRRIAARWRAKEAQLDVDLLPAFLFGKWAEAGRLAAATRTPEFFERRANRRILRDFLKDSVEEAVPYLNEVRRVWDRGDLRDDDYKALATSFGQVIGIYQAHASESD